MFLTFRHFGACPPERDRDTASSTPDPSPFLSESAPPEIVTGSGKSIDGTQAFPDFWANCALTHHRRRHVLWDNLFLQP